MPLVTLLKDDWRHSLANVVGSAKSNLLIASPFVSQNGVRFVLDNLHESFIEGGTLTFVTNLSPLNLIQGSTDPHSIQELANQAFLVSIFHLPRLHAKTYIADSSKAIITSGNLTQGGLSHNYEYGVLIEDPDLVEETRSDISDYAALGARIGRQELSQYCDAADKAQAAYRKQQTSVTQAAKQQFDETFRAAEDELIRFRLAEGPIHTVFENTIVYLLKKYGSLSTQELHPLIKDIHPDLCDDSVDRVIDGRHFGKKWKHAVRTAQQHLQKKGMIHLRDGRWSDLG